MMNSTTFARHYEAGFQRTVRFLRARGIDEEGALESAQAAWARGWERRSQLRDEQKVVSWINSIAINLFRKRCRRDSRMTSLTVKHEAVHHESSEIEEKADTRALRGIDAQNSLDLCEPNVRRMLLQRYFKGMCMREIAESNGRSEVAIRVQLYRARRRLRLLLTEPSGPDRPRLGTRSEEDTEGEIRQALAS